MSREIVVGHAKRKERRQAAPRKTAERVEEQAVLDDGTVDLILDLRLGTDEGDPVAGIFHAFVASVVFWIALGAALTYLS
jgi:hypothetical protein